MKIHVIGSGSAGNCYIFENSTSALILEAGVPFKEVKKALNFNLRKVVGVLVTHEHGDHAKAIKDMVNAGLDVYASQGTINATNIKHHRLHVIKPKVQFKVGEFQILPFDVKHDCAEPLGFLVNHKECGKVLFVTDSYYLAYTFSGLNHLLVEANYGREILAKRISEGKVINMVSNRIIKSHMNLETCKDLLRANDLSAVHNIVLIHLSDANSDAALFKKEVHELTGKSVHIALPGMVVDVSLERF